MTAVGYYVFTRLRIDVKLLLDSVQLEQFDFDKVIRRMHQSPDIALC